MLSSPGGLPCRPTAGDEQFAPGDCAQPWTVIPSFAPWRTYSWLSPDKLLVLCADFGNIHAWKEFVRRFDRLILITVRRVVRRYGPTDPELCRDLAQMVYVKLCDHEGRLLRTFVPVREGASFGYVKVLAANVVHDYFRGQGRHRFESLPDDMPSGSHNDQRIFLGEIDEFLRHTVSERNREIFWLHHRHGMKAREIAALPGIALKLKGVETALKKVRDLVIAEFSDKQRKRGTKVVSEESNEVL